MTENLPIIALVQPNTKTDCDNPHRRIIGLDIDAYDQQFHFDISVANQQARLTDIVPLAHAISQKITTAAIDNSKALGDNIPCQRGCAACCNYLIPLSIPEAFWLREKILAAPQCQRQVIMRSTLLAARRLLKHKPPKWLAQETCKESETPVDPNLLSNWYANLEKPCPFIYKGECIIYHQRPLACREYFVTGSARACKGQRGEAKVLDIAVHILEVLTELAAEIENCDHESIMLPLALVWCEDNLDRAQRQFSAITMVERFVEILQAVVTQKTVESFT